MLRIAITGGAGSGKSTVARMFQELGAEVLDADAAARKAVAPGQHAWEELRRALGAEFFQADGRLDRARVAAAVFADPEARRRLEAIVHPRVAQELEAQIKELARRGARLVMVEVPLLYEAGLEGRYDRVIVVYAGEADQARRLAARDRRDETEIAGILKAQWPLSEKLARADFVVDNRGTKAATRRQVAKIWGELEKIILTGENKKVSVP